MSSIPPASPQPNVAAALEPASIPLASWRPLRWAARLLLGAVAAVWSLLLIAWLTLHWGILPHIQQWRGPIEARASRALGVPVRIGSIEVQSSGWVPSFELREVVVLDASGQPALRLPHVFAAISARSLLSLEIGFEQLLIDGAQLEVRRDGLGRIFVAGMNLGNQASPADGGPAADWFFAQREFVLRGGSLRWTDEQRGVPSIQFDNVQLVVRNGVRDHELRVDANPPADWGARFTAVGRFTQPLLTRRGDWRRWSGQVYASLPEADIRPLRQYASLPFDWSEGEGALRGWVEVRNGQPDAATFDVALQTMALRLAPDLSPLRLEDLEGRLVTQRSPAGVVLQAQHLSFVDGDGTRWPQGDLKLSLRRPEGQSPSGGELTAQRLDLRQLAQIASRVPLEESARKVLSDIDPRGSVSDLSASWEGPIGAPRRYRAKALVSGLFLAARASTESGVGRPGLRGADVQVELNEAGGQARVGMNGGAIELPGVFEDPLLVLDQLSAQLAWRIEVARAPATAPRLSLQVQQARFSNADAHGELQASWSSGADGAARFPGRLELDATLLNGVAKRTYRYLPLSIPRGTREYFEGAVQGGAIASASFHVKGELKDFPYAGFRPATQGAGKAADREGEFRIAAKINDATFAFVPDSPTSVSPWPALAKANVELDLDHGVLELRNGTAQMGPLQWTKVLGTIGHFDSDPAVSLETTASGPLAEMVRVVNVTPVGTWIGHALAAATATGGAELRLGLELPLKHIEASRANGSLQLSGNDLRIGADSPLLADSTGRVDFSNNSFAVVGASAKLFGGGARFDGGSQADGSIRFTGQGTLSAEGLRGAAELGSAAGAASVLSGQTSYRATLGFVHGKSELSITSNLVGLAFKLPAPLNKAAETPLALRYESTVDPASLGPGQAARDTVRFDLGDVIQAQYLRDISGEQPVVERGGVGVLDAAPQPSAGVAASINLKTLVVDEWEAVYDSLLGEGSGARDSRETGTKSSYLPDSIGLRVQELTVGERRLTHLSAGLSREAGLWRANLDADQLAGYVEYRPPSRAGSAAAGRVFARLSRLSLPKSDVEQVETLLDEQPSSLPALDVVVEEFELRGKKLGRLDVEATNRSSGLGRDALRDWELSKFNLTTPEAQFTATGRWSAVGAASGHGAPLPRRSVMDFKLQVSDSGALLDRLGTSKAIRGGRGQLSGQIGWIGSPFSLDYASLEGQINVAIDSGQFLKVDPGAARLLGVLSLQSLPRRLSLDFRDLFQQGFAFDSITGDVKIAQGVAETNNLRMRGVQAVVLMEGSADIEHETQDLRVIVVPEINAGTAALAYAVINPAIGLGAFLAQAILKKPLTQAGTREFHVSGPWADPKVERVDRKFGDDLPSAAPASSVPAKN